MTVRFRFASTRAAAGLSGQLLRDRAGNTLAIIAAGLFPLLALVGGGIDMGRSYLAQSRLQQACDAGVLAARNKLGSAIALTGTPPADANTVGNRFFNQNFRTGSYGTKNRSFAMTLEADYSISGVAHVDVPTTIMYLFGAKTVAIDAKCQAKLNFSNTDVMFVLDTTGSMAELTPDNVPRIDALRAVVKNFHAQIEGSKKPGTRVRYGFVPYATNVNVGTLLKADWMVDKWTYQSRETKSLGSSNQRVYDYKYQVITEGRTNFTETVKTCRNSDRDTVYGSNNVISTNPEEFWYDSYSNGDEIWSCIANDIGTFTITGVRYKDHVERTTAKYSHDAMQQNWIFTYKPVAYDVSGIKGANGGDPVAPGKIVNQNLFYPKADGSPNPVDAWYTGCIEERDTYEIDDYSNVDLNRALDLDIDLVPTAGKPATQWRPQFSSMIFDRAMWWDGTGTFSPAAVDSYYDFLAPGWTEYAACPGAARKLAEMTSSDVAGYVDALPVAGSTYHDIGMIWGGRLLSPTGLFASENADESGKPTSRHMIFLTDGLTAPLDISYGSYGVEPLDQRRWNPASPLSLTAIIEKRFGVACDEVKKRNITVWVIGFGTTLNPVMTACAGPGHSFEAKSASELNDVFNKIAAQMGDLRISK